MRYLSWNVGIFRQFSRKGGLDEKREALLAPHAQATSVARRPNTLRGTGAQRLIYGRYGSHVAMGHNLWLQFGADEHPCTTYFDVHQGYRVLTHSYVALASDKSEWNSTQRVQASHRNPGNHPAWVNFRGGLARIYVNPRFNYNGLLKQQLRV